MPQNAKKLQEIHEALATFKGELSANNLQMDKMHTDLAHASAEVESLHKQLEVVKRDLHDNLGTSAGLASMEDASMSFGISVLGHEEEDLIEQRHVLEQQFESLKEQAAQAESDRKQVKAIFSKIYPVADKIAGMAAGFAPETSVEQLLEYWRLLNDARLVAKQQAEREDYLTDAEYFAAKDLYSDKQAEYRKAALIVFKKIMNQLPEELQLLKVLYDLGEYQAVENYLKRFLSLPANDEKYHEFLRKVAQVVNIKSTNRASEAIIKESMRFPYKFDSKENLALETMNAMQEMIPTMATFGILPIEREAPPIQFIDLPTSTRNSLIEQRAFALKLNAYLSLTDGDPSSPARAQLQQYYKEIESNISNCLLNHENFTQASMKFDRIKADFVKFEKEFRRYLYRSRLTDTTSMLIGAVGTVSGAAFGAQLGSALNATMGEAMRPTVGDELAESVVQQGVMTNWLMAGSTALAGSFSLYMVYKRAKYESENLKSAEHEENKELLDKVGPVNFEFIAGIDKLFSKHGATPIGKMRTVGTTAIQAFWNELKKSPTFMALAATFFVGIAIPTVMSIMSNPILWPIAALVGIVTAIEVSAWKIDFGDTTIGKNLAEALSITTSAVRDGVDILLRPITALVQNLARGNMLYSIVTTVGAVALGVAAATLMPTIAPALVSNEILGLAVGVYLGLSVGSVIDELYIRPRIELATTQDTLQKIDIDLTPHEEAILDRIYHQLSKILIQHFKNRHAVLEAEVVTASKQMEVNPELVRPLAAEVSKLELDWDAIRQILQRPEDLQRAELLCDRLDSYLERQYELARQKLIDLAAARKLERAEARKIEIKPKAMLFEKMPPGLEASPDLGMSLFNEADYEHERAELKDIADLKKIILHIRPNP